MLVPLFKQGEDAQQERGFTLLELIVAMMVSSLLVVTVGSVLSVSQRSVAHLNNQLTLRNSLFGTIHALRSDLQLAGFNFPGQTSVRLADSESIIDVGANGDQIAYVYRKSAQIYQNVVYRYQPISASRGVIKICEKQTEQPLSVEDAARSGDTGDCYSLFDANHISVNHFSITYQPIVGASARSALVTVSITAFLTHDSSVSETVSFQIVQRNWTG
jgi:type IV pilus assembly protein PilW